MKSFVIVVAFQKSQGNLEKNREFNGLMTLFWPCTRPAAVPATVLLISQGAHKDNNVAHGIVCGLQMTLGFHRSYSCSSFLGEGRAVRTEVEKVLPVVHEEVEKVLRLKVELEEGVAETEAEMPEGVKEGGAAVRRYLFCWRRVQRRDLLSWRKEL